MKKPNLVFVFADQMRRDIGAYGNDDVITPNLDKMAVDGMRMDNTVCCGPQCSPARACMLTGTYPATNGMLINDTPLNDYILKGKRSIAYELGDAGYKTGYIGKWHLFGPSSVRETYIPPGIHRLGFNDLWAVNNCSHRYMNNFYYLNDNPEKVYIDGYDADHQTDLALNFISEYREKPFALFVSWGPPHNPCGEVPQKWKDLYDADVLSWRPNVCDLKEDLFSKHHIYKKERNRKPDNEWLRGYYANITALDNNIGRIAEKLKQEGLEDNTIFVFTSDHGDMLWSQGVMLKNAPWEESAGIPFILKYPDKIKAGLSSDVPFNTVDFMPTLLRLMNLSIPDYVQGTDVSHILLGNQGDEPEASYIMAAYRWANYPEWRGVRTKRYTYAKTLEGAWLLYDNDVDPYQQNNLANKPEYKELQHKLDKLTDDIGISTGDRFESWDVLNQEMETRRKNWLLEYGYPLTDSI